MTEYIDRKALIEHIEKDPLYDLVEQYGVTEVIESFPTADVQPVKHGRWVLDNPEQALMYCSNCNLLNLNWKWKYCPYCGALMGDEDDV